MPTFYKTTPHGRNFEKITQKYMSRQYNNIIILLACLMSVVMCAGCATGRAPDVGTTRVTVRTDTVRDTVLIAKTNIIRQ